MLQNTDRVGPDCTWQHESRNLRLSQALLERQELTYPLQHELDKKVHRRIGHFGIHVKQCSLQLHVANRHTDTTDTTDTFGDGAVLGSARGGGCTDPPRVLGIIKKP